MTRILGKQLVWGLVLLTLISWASPSAARADFTSGMKEVGKATAYVTPVGCSLLTSAYSGLYMIYDQGAPQRWRTAGYVCGGLSLALGTYLLVDDRFETSSGTVLGTIPIVIGTSAILTALLVGAPDDIVGDMAFVSPWIGERSAGLAWSGRF